MINLHKRRLRKKQQRKQQRWCCPALSHCLLLRRNVDLASGCLSPQLLVLGPPAVVEREREIGQRKASFSYDEYYPQPGFLRSQNSLDDILDFKKPELTCISEEGIADMDLPENILEELEFMDGITSCNKVSLWSLKTQGGDKQLFFYDKILSKNAYCE